MNPPPKSRRYILYNSPVHAAAQGSFKAMLSVSDLLCFWLLSMWPPICSISNGMKLFLANCHRVQSSLNDSEYQFTFSLGYVPIRWPTCSDLSPESPWFQAHQEGWSLHFPVTQWMTNPPHQHSQGWEPRRVVQGGWQANIPVFVTVFV